jgi:hypothetical protein
VPALNLFCQHVAVLSVRRGAGAGRLSKHFDACPFVFNKLLIERAFLACLVKSSFWPYLAGDDDVELAAEKDSAFRRAARWCGA